MAPKGGSGLLDHVARSKHPVEAIVQRPQHAGQKGYQEFMKYAEDIGAYKGAQQGDGKVTMSPKDLHIGRNTPKKSSRQLKKEKSLLFARKQNKGAVQGALEANNMLTSMIKDGKGSKMQISAESDKWFSLEEFSIENLDLSGTDDSGTEKYRHLSKGDVLLRKASLPKYKKSKKKKKFSETKTATIMRNLMRFGGMRGLMAAAAAAQEAESESESEEDEPETGDYAGVSEAARPLRGMSAIKKFFLNKGKHGEADEMIRHEDIVEQEGLSHLVDESRFKASSRNATEQLAIDILNRRAVKAPVKPPKVSNVIEQAMMEEQIRKLKRMGKYAEFKGASRDFKEMVLESLRNRADPYAKWGDTMDGLKRKKAGPLGSDLTESTKGNHTKTRKGGRRASSGSARAAADMNIQGNSFGRPGMKVIRNNSGNDRIRTLSSGLKVWEDPVYQVPNGFAYEQVLPYDINRNLTKRPVGQYNGPWKVRSKVSTHMELLRERENRREDIHGHHVEYNSMIKQKKTPGNVEQEKNIVMELKERNAAWDLPSTLQDPTFNSVRLGGLLNLMSNSPRNCRINFETKNLKDSFIIPGQGMAADPPYKGLRPDEEEKGGNPKQGFKSVIPMSRNASVRSEDSKISGLHDNGSAGENSTNEMANSAQPPESDAGVTKHRQPSSAESDAKVGFSIDTKPKESDIHTTPSVESSFGRRSMTMDDIVNGYPLVPLCCDRTFRKRVDPKKTEVWKTSLSEKTKLLKDNHRLETVIANRSKKENRVLASKREKDKNKDTLRKRNILLGKVDLEDEAVYPARVRERQAVSRLKKPPAESPAPPAVTAVPDISIEKKGHFKLACTRENEKLRRPMSAVVSSRTRLDRKEGRCVEEFDTVDGTLDEKEQYLAYVKKKTTSGTKRKGGTRPATAVPKKTESSPIANEPLPIEYYMEKLSSILQALVQCPEDEADENVYHLRDFLFAQLSEDVGEDRWDEKVKTMVEMCGRIVHEDAIASEITREYYDYMRERGLSTLSGNSARGNASARVGQAESQESSGEGNAPGGERGDGGSRDSGSGGHGTSGHGGDDGGRRGGDGERRHNGGYLQNDSDGDDDDEEEEAEEEEEEGSASQQGSVPFEDLEFSDAVTKMTEMLPKHIQDIRVNAISQHAAVIAELYSGEVPQGASVLPEDKSETSKHELKSEKTSTANIDELLVQQASKMALEYRGIPDAQVQNEAVPERDVARHRYAYEIYKNIEDKELRENLASTKIQASYRGHSARRKLNEVPRNLDTAAKEAYVTVEDHMTSGRRGSTSYQRQLQQQTEQEKEIEQEKINIVLDKKENVALERKISSENLPRLMKRRKSSEAVAATELLIGQRNVDPETQPAIVFAAALESLADMPEQPVWVKGRRRLSRLSNSGDSGSVLSLAHQDPSEGVKAEEKLIPSKEVAEEPLEIPESPVKQSIAPPVADEKKDEYENAGFVFYSEPISDSSESEGDGWDSPEMSESKKARLTSYTRKTNSVETLSEGPRSIFSVGNTPLLDPSGHPVPEQLQLETPESIWGAGALVVSLANSPGGSGGSVPSPNDDNGPIDPRRIASMDWVPPRRNRPASLPHRQMTSAGSSGSGTPRGKIVKAAGANPLSTSARPNSHDKFSPAAELKEPARRKYVSSLPSHMRGAFD